MRTIEGWGELDAGRYGLNWHGWEDWATRIETGGEFACVLALRMDRQMRYAVEMARRRSERE